MKDLNLIDAETVADELGVSREFAYRIIKEMNDELRKLGWYTVAGRINRKYFEEKKIEGQYSKVGKSKGML